MHLGIPHLGLNAGIAGFWPGSLFAAGEQGVWYDYSDWSTLFQDSAGTTPVTAVGQPVGKVLDKSGRGNHKTQATAINRPILQQDASGYYYLAWNGTNSGMVTAAIDFTGTAQVNVFAGLQKVSDAATGIALELSTSLSSFSGTFNIQAPVGASSANIRLGAKGTLATSTTQSEAANEALVFTGIVDIAAPRIASRKNGAYNGQDTATSMGTGNFGNFPLYIGARAGTSLFFNGNMYSLIVRGAASSAAQIASAERYVGSRMGISL